MSTTIPTTTYTGPKGGSVSGSGQVTVRPTNVTASGEVSASAANGNQAEAQGSATITTNNLSASGSWSGTNVGGSASLQENSDGGQLTYSTEHLGSGTVAVPGTLFDAVA